MEDRRLGASILQMAAAEVLQPVLLMLLQRLPARRTRHGHKVAVRAGVEARFLESLLIVKSQILVFTKS